MGQSREKPNFGAQEPLVGPGIARPGFQSLDRHLLSGLEVLRQKDGTRSSLAQLFENAVAPVQCIDCMPTTRITPCKFCKSPSKSGLGTRGPGSLILSNIFEDANRYKILLLFNF